jgi:PAS domain S-box-containing protein
MINEDKLQESKFRYKLFSVNNYTWEFILDAGGNWLYSSPACKKITGFSNKELLNDQNLFYDMILPDHSKRVLKHFDSEPGLISSIEDFEFPIINRHKEFKWISHSCSPVFDDSGNIIGRYCNNHDITKYKKLMKDYKVTQVAVQNAKKITTLFLANISHEIRTPLTTILGNTDLIEELLIDSSNEDLKECFNWIRDSGERLMNTVHGILDLSLIESGNYPHNPKSVQFYKILGTIIKKYKSITHKKNIKLSYENQALDLVISADEGQLIKALSYLIDNAIKYTDEGQIDINLKYIHNDPVLTIADTGVGIDEEYLNRIFEPFSQERTDFIVKYQGLGIGMAITKHCLEANGASIVINSQIDVGTTIVITF